MDKKTSTSTMKKSTTRPRTSTTANSKTSGTSRPSSGTTRPSSGTTRPSSGTTRPSSGTTRPSSGTTRPSSGTARASSSASTTRSTSRTGHLIGSADRRAVFKKCTENNLDDRKKYEVSNVKYDDAKLSQSQMQSIIKWALDKWKTKGDVDFNLKTYKGMKTLEEELLCRFLRPSELIRLMYMMDMSIFIREVTVPIKPTISAEDIVGHLGAHAYTLTKKFDLLYVWYHSEGNKLVMYAVEHGYKGGEGKGKIERAIKFLEGKGFVNPDKSIVWKMKHTPVQPGSAADKHLKNLT
jgi:hypothetical protein